MNVCFRTRLYGCWCEVYYAFVQQTVVVVAASGSDMDMHVAAMWIWSDDEAGIIY